MEEHKITHTVFGQTGKAPRLDVFVTEQLNLFPRSQLKQRLKEVFLNGRPVKMGKKVKNGDIIEIIYTDLPPVNLGPEAMPLDILYEDEDVVVINKPRGLVVHPGAGNRTNTLANGLLAHCAGLGAAFASQFDIPQEILHIIAAHSKEGDGARRTVEAIIVNHADFINFEALKLE